MTESVKSKNRDTEKYLEMYVDEDGGFRDEKGDGKDDGGAEIEVAN